MQISSYRHLRVKKCIYTATQNYFSWWYIEVLWSETISLCKKLNIICNIIICNPEPQANGEIRFFFVNWFIWTAKLIHLFNHAMITHEHICSSSVWVELFPQFSDCWRNWSTESVHSSQHQIRRCIASFQVRVAVRRLKVSFDWVTCRSVPLEPQTVSDTLVQLGELVQLVH